MMKNRITTLALCTLVTLALVFIAARSDAQTYSYDDLGRLTRVAYADGTSLDYTYDANGNRLTLAANTATGGTGGTGGGTTPAADGGGGGGGGGCYIRALTDGEITAVSRENPSRLSATPWMWAAVFSCMAPAFSAVWFVLRRRKPYV